MENNTNIKAGQVYKAKVNKIVSFGAFIEVDGTEGLMHISQIVPVRLHQPEEIISEGIIIDVICLEAEGEKLRFSMIDVAQEDEIVAAKVAKAIEKGQKQSSSRPRRDDRRQGGNSRGRNERSRGGFNKDRNSRGERSDRPRRDFGDRAQRGERNNSDKPRRDFSDRPRRSDDRNDRPQRNDRSDRSRRDFGDKPRSERPRKDFGDRPQRGERSDRQKRNFGDKPQRSFNDRPRRDFDTPSESHKDALGTATRQKRDKKTKVYSK